MIAVGTAQGRRPFGDTEGKQTQRQSRDVGQHVSGIRQESQAVGQKTANQLGKEIDKADGQCDFQSLCFGMTLHVRQGYSARGIRSRGRTS